MTRRTCPECGQYAGGHYLGCPNDDGPDDEREEQDVDNDLDDAEGDE